jgi:hypothetical protein
MNERGEIVGNVGDAKTFNQFWGTAVLWTPGSKRSLVEGEGVAINDRGQVALNWDDEWIFWQGGKIRYHGTGEATALNERGQVAIAIDNLDETAAALWRMARPRVCRCSRAMKAAQRSR